ncbi:MAG: ribosome assembly RNA-binding protein YhbY [Acidiferrobacterales bacterium]|jgi:RNA-binding protein|nr:ribosome assembly RNA-binding protein YhbY [Acidiferrobacterales bacterium]
MSLTGKQRHYLRGLAHHSKPIVTLGDAGATAAVMLEIEQALDHHELVKLKLRVGDRQARHETLEQICTETGAEAVQEIGQMAVIYRPAKNPKISLPA